MLIINNKITCYCSGLCKIDIDSTLSLAYRKGDRLFITGPIDLSLPYPFIREIFVSTSGVISLGCRERVDLLYIAIDLTILPPLKVVKTSYLNYRSKSHSCKRAFKTKAMEGK